MSVNVARIFRATQHLSEAEQLELIQIISQSLRQKVAQFKVDAISPGVRRADPITDLAQLVADFWPQDESADDINAYIAHTRCLKTSLG